MMCRALPEVCNVVSNIKEVTDAPICLGGPQPTTLPEFTLKPTKADFAVIGEGENTILELVQFIEDKRDDFDKINGLAYVDKEGKVGINKPRELIKNLDTIPFPAWHFMPPVTYNITSVLASIERYPVAPIVTTRGCPFRCSFCGSPAVWRGTFRMRSPGNVVDEIELLLDEYGIKEIFISDDNFTLVKKHAMGVCEEIIKRKLDISMACPNGVRIDRLDNELLRAMRNAGCHLLGFGIESGNQEILNRANKKLNLKLVPEVVKNAKEMGMITYGFFIIGLPGETTKTIRETIKFAKSLLLDRAWFNILVPYPGTDVFELFTENRTLDEVDWKNIDTSIGMIASGIKYTDLDAADLVYWQKRAVREFYFRPKIILNVLRHFGYRNVKTLLKTTFFKNLFPKIKQREKTY